MNSQLHVLLYLFSPAHNFLHLPYFYRIVGKQADFKITLWATKMQFSMLVPF